MNLLKLDGRYLNLEHVAMIEILESCIEVVTPYEVLRLKGADADKVLLAVERFAEQTRLRLQTSVHA